MSVDEAKHQVAEPGQSRTGASALLSQDGPIAQVLPGFTTRSQQQAMAARIEQALRDGGTLLCEAGTGTGKTLAYLVPCLDGDRKTIISTATKTLQDQLFERDIPLVQEALGSRMSVALLKGRANYLCLHRLEQAHGSRELAPVEQDDLAYVAEWARHTDNGDVANAAGLPDDSSIWPNVTSTVDNCLGQSCDYFDECFVVKARRDAASADVVVVNHHLLFADMALREEGFAELLPSADIIVLDEAHQVPDVASTFFGSSLSSRQLRDLCRDAAAARESEAADMPTLRDAAGELEISTANLVRSLSRFGPRGEWSQLGDKVHVGEDFNALCRSLHRLRDQLELASERGPNAENCYARALRFCARLDLFSSDSEDVDFQWIRWFETSARGAVLHATPVSIADPFQSMTGSYSGAWIFTSATLSVNGDFSHFKRELGITEASEGCWDSPFDYAAQALLYLPRIGLEPRDPAYLDAIVNLSVPLIEATRGRTFLLFTSYRALDACASLLRERTNFPLLIQGHAPRAELLKQFEDLGNAVLLGTATFWQGIDVRGAGLSCVIIDKLPFAPPDDPITRSRISALKADGGNPFFDYQVPEAVITLKQGAGRLIRDDKDRGVLVLCDPRLETKSYGKSFLDALPAMTRTNDFAQVIKFLETL
ncbi:MAG: ATP-dependent DNA helicase DinG [Gammaproteobacteria bacterium]|jgi:ATP-dependent DNA helicase DinG